MFMLTTGPGMSLAFPDVCNTPMPAPVPIPYPNLGFSSVSVPAVYNVLVGCMPAVNQMSMGTVSVGDQAGVAGGVADGIFGGQTNYNVGCFTIFVGGAPAQRLTSVTGQNSLVKTPNAVGMTLVPSQVSVLTLG
ncbi:DUF4150 domain-containing protein [Desulfothermus okinawensis JCM 13304]